MTPKAREHRFRRIKEIGCLPCMMKGFYSYPEIHHLNLGGKAGQKRRGDEFTIGLCPWHHQGKGTVPEYLGPSLARNSREFRRVFGKDDDLLIAQNHLISKADSLLKNFN